MKNKHFEFRLCPNGYHYLYFGNDLYITPKGDYVILEQSDDVEELLDESNDEKERLKRINKGQELEIVRLHNLADTMSSVLRELGIYNVYDDETIEEVKNKLKGDAE